MDAGNRIAELQIVSNTSGIHLDWTYVSKDPSYSDEEARREMRKSLEVMKGLEGSAARLKVNLQVVPSETGKRLPPGFGFDQKRRELQDEVDRPVGELVKKALEVEDWN